MADSNIVSPQDLLVSSPELLKFIADNVRKIITKHDPHTDSSLTLEIEELIRSNAKLGDEIDNLTGKVSKSEQEKLLKAIYKSIKNNAADVSIGILDQYPLERSRLLLKILDSTEKMSSPKSTQSKPSGPPVLNVSNISEPTLKSFVTNNFTIDSDSNATAGDNLANVVNVEIVQKAEDSLMALTTELKQMKDSLSTASDDELSSINDAIDAKEAEIESVHALILSFGALAKDNKNSRRLNAATQKKIEETTKKSAEVIQSRMSNGVNGVVDDFGKLRQGSSRFSSTLEGMADVTSSVSSTMGSLGGTIGRSTGDLGNIFSHLGHMARGPLGMFTAALAIAAIGLKNYQEKLDLSRSYGGGTGMVNTVGEMEVKTLLEPEQLKALSDSISGAFGVSLGRNQKEMERVAIKQRLTERVMGKEYADAQVEALTSLKGVLTSKTPTGMMDELSSQTSALAKTLGISNKLALDQIKAIHENSKVLTEGRAKEDAKKFESQMKDIQSGLVSMGMSVESATELTAKAAENIATKEGLSKQETKRQFIKEAGGEALATKKSMLAKEGITDEEEQALTTRALQAGGAQNLSPEDQKKLLLISSANEVAGGIAKATQFKKQKEAAPNSTEWANATSKLNQYGADGADFKSYESLSTKVDKNEIGGIGDKFNAGKAESSTRAGGEAVNPQVNKMLLAMGATDEASRREKFKDLKANISKDDNQAKKTETDNNKRQMLSSKADEYNISKTDKNGNAKSGAQLDAELRNKIDNDGHLTDKEKESKKAALDQIDDDAWQASHVKEIEAGTKRLENKQNFAGVDGSTYKDTIADPNLEKNLGNLSSTSVEKGADDVETAAKTLNNEISSLVGEMSLLTLALWAVAGAVIALVASNMKGSIVDFFKKSDFFKKGAFKNLGKTLSNGFESVKTVGSTLWNGDKVKTKGIKGTLSTAWENKGKIASGAGSKIAGAAKAVPGLISTGASAVTPMLGAGFKAATSGLGALGGGLLKFAGPIGLAVGAVMAAKGAIDGWGEANKIFATETPTLGQKVSGAFGGIVESLSFGLISMDTSAKWFNNSFGFIYDSLGNTFGKIMDGISSWIDHMKSIFEPLISAISDIFGGLIDTVSGIFGFVIGIFTGDFELIKTSFGKIFSGIGKLIMAIPKLIWETLVAGFKLLWEIPRLIGQALLGIVGGIWDLGEAVVDGLINVITGIPAAIGNAFSAIGDWISNFSFTDMVITPLTDMIVGGFQSMVDWVLDLIPDIWPFNGDDDKDARKSEKAEKAARAKNEEEAKKTGKPVKLTEQQTKQKAVDDKARLNSLEKAKYIDQDWVGSNDVNMKNVKNGLDQGKITAKDLQIMIDSGVGTTEEKELKALIAAQAKKAKGAPTKPAPTKPGEKPAPTKPGEKAKTTAPAKPKDYSLIEANGITFEKANALKQKAAKMGEHNLSAQEKIDLALVKEDEKNQTPAQQMRAKLAGTTPPMNKKPDDIVKNMEQAQHQKALDSAPGWLLSKDMKAEYLKMQNLAGKSPVTKERATELKTKAATVGQDKMTKKERAELELVKADEKNKVNALSPEHQKALASAPDWLLPEDMKSMKVHAQNNMKTPLNAVPTQSPNKLQTAGIPTSKTSAVVDPSNFDRSFSAGFKTMNPTFNKMIETNRQGFNDTTSSIATGNTALGIGNVLATTTSMNTTTANTHLVNTKKGIDETNKQAVAQSGFFSKLAAGGLFGEIGKKISSSMDAAKSAFATARKGGAGFFGSLWEGAKGGVKELIGGKAADNKKELEAAAVKSGITDPKEMAMFMGQMGHESGGFSQMQEGKYSAETVWKLRGGQLAKKGVTLDQLKADEAKGGKSAMYEHMYGGRMGNNAPGDAERYKGRGFTQLTGKDNYADMTQRLQKKGVNVDLLKNPEMAADPKIAAQIATLFWEKSGAKAEAQKGNIKGVTQRINGGQNGAGDREKRTSEAYAEYSKSMPKGTVAAKPATPSATTAKPKSPATTVATKSATPSATTTAPTIIPAQPKTTPLTASAPLLPLPKSNQSPLAAKVATVGFGGLTPDEQKSYLDSKRKPMNPMAVMSSMSSMSPSAKNISDTFKNISTNNVAGKSLSDLNSTTGTSGLNGLTNVPSATSVMNTSSTSSTTNNTQVTPQKTAEDYLQSIDAKLATLNALNQAQVGHLGKSSLEVAKQTTTQSKQLKAAVDRDGVNNAQQIVNAPIKQV